MVEAVPHAGVLTQDNVREPPALEKGHGAGRPIRGPVRTRIEEHPVVDAQGALIGLGQRGRAVHLDGNRWTGAAITAALKWIKSIVSEPEVNEIYEGKIVKIMEFGAFVNFFGARDGLVHVSELAPQRVQKVSDVVSEGQMVKVKFLGMDNRGKIRLSMKVVDQVTGEDLTAKQEAAGTADGA